MIDLQRLGAWLDQHGVAERGAPVAAEAISGGSQNEIFVIQRGDVRAVLRTPPAHAPAGRDDGILREWRVLQALRGSDVPHAPALAVCADAAVLGRPFYLMGVVDGWSATTALAGAPLPQPFDTDADARRGLGLAMVEGAALMSRFNWQAAGLADFGRPDGFHERQVDRWTAFFERIRGRDLPGVDVASSWLRAHRPIDFVPGLMHGDYQFANVMFGHGAPARLAAVIDWEMATIGDPKLDLGWLVQGWPVAGEDTTTGMLAFPVLHGMPRRDEMVAHYAALSGRQVDDIDYYVILARWKLAIVLEQGFQRAAGDPRLQAFGDMVLALMQAAADLAETTDYAR